MNNISFTDAFLFYNFATYFYVLLSASKADCIDASRSLCNIPNIDTSPSVYKSAQIDTNQYSYNTGYTGTLILRYNNAHLEANYADRNNVLRGNQNPAMILPVNTPLSVPTTL